MNKQDQNSVHWCGSLRYVTFLASPDALEMMLVTEWLSESLWWVMITIEDLNDVSLAIEDTEEDEEDEEVI